MPNRVTEQEVEDNIISIERDKENARSFYYKLHLQRRHECRLLQVFFQQDQDE